MVSSNTFCFSIGVCDHVWFQGARLPKQRMVGERIGLAPISARNSSQTSPVVRFDALLDRGTNFMIAHLVLRLPRQNGSSLR